MTGCERLREEDSESQPSLGTLGDTVSKHPYTISRKQTHLPQQSPAPKKANTKTEKEKKKRKKGRKKASSNDKANIVFYHSPKEMTLKEASGAPEVR